MPDWFVLVLRETPVSRLRAVSVAPTITPPLGSAIVPVSVAVGVSPRNKTLVSAHRRYSPPLTHRLGLLILWVYRQSTVKLDSNTVWGRLAACPPENHLQYA